MKRITRGVQKRRSLIALPVECSERLQEKSQINPQSWICQLRRGFAEKTPEEWLPSQYRAIFSHEAQG